MIGLFQPGEVIIMRCSTEFKKLVKKRILQGRSMGINSNKYKFYSSSIVGGGLSIGTGLGLAIKKKK